MRQSHRRLAILASVLLLAGYSSRCELIHSDARLLTDETLIDVPELDGAFLYGGEIPFEITRLGNGQYEYTGLSYRLPDPDRVPAEVLEELTATFEALNLPEGPGAAPAPLLEALRDVGASCHWVGFGDRHCALEIAELFEPHYPGILAFEQALAALPSQVFRQRVLFSLHDLGQGRLAAQQEMPFVPAASQYHEVYARWTEAEVSSDIYDWFFRYISYASDLTGQTLFFEGEMGASVSSVALLRRLDDGIFAVVPIDACTSADHLAAYGFEGFERPENGSSRDAFFVRPIADGNETDFVGMLKACLPEDVTGDFRFWKVGVEAPPLPAAGEE